MCALVSSLFTEPEPQFIAVWSLLEHSARLPLLVRASIDHRERATFRVLALTLRKQPANSTLLALDWPPGSVTAPWMASPLRLSRISVSFEPSMKIALQKTILSFAFLGRIVWIDDVGIVVGKILEIDKFELSLRSSWKRYY